MISAERHGSTSRTYEDDDELDDWTEDTGSGSIVDGSFLNSSNGGVRIIIDSEHTQHFSSLRHINSVVFSTDKHSLACANSFINYSSMVKIGSIKGTLCKSGAYAKLFYSKDNSLMLVVVEAFIPEGLLVSFTQQFDVFSFSFVIVLGNVDLTKLHQSDPLDMLRLNRIRLMPTKTNLDTNDAEAINFDSIGIDLEIGTLITGVSAALFNFAEHRGLSAILLLTPTKAFMSVAAMNTFEQALPLFKLVSNGSYKNPAHSDYQALLKHDPFISKTENLYC